MFCISGNTPLFITSSDNQVHLLCTMAIVCGSLKGFVLDHEDSINDIYNKVLNNGSSNEVSIDLGNGKTRENVDWL